MAAIETSSAVRLVLASTLQRLPLERRADLALALVSRAEDATDHNLPSMVWFGLIPLGDSAPMDLVRVAEKCLWPATLNAIARRLAESSSRAPEALEALISISSAQPASSRKTVLNGMSEGFRGWRKATKPGSWNRFIAGIDGDSTSTRQISELNILFGEGRSADELRGVVGDSKSDPRTRLNALERLIEMRASGLRQICEDLLDVRHLTKAALQGLSFFDDPGLGPLLAGRYQKFSPEDRPGLVTVLASRPVFARALLNRMKSGLIPRGDLTAFHARQIEAFKDAGLSFELREVWGRIQPTDRQANHCPIPAYAPFLQNGWIICFRFPGFYPGLVCSAPWGHEPSQSLPMPQSLSNILLHLIFSTKDRQPWLEKGVREKAHAFLAGAVRQCECEASITKKNTTTPAPSRRNTEPFFPNN